MYMEEYISEQEKVENTENTMEEVDQFQLLEEKIDRLIGFVTKLRQEKISLEEKIQEQEHLITELREQVERLQADKERAKERISYVLSKIDQIDTEEHGE